MERLPLTGLKVLDLTRARSGPTAARQFADWGADVIMVESPSGGNDIAGSREGSDFQNLHRNKRSIALDLKDDGDKVAFLKLVESADIILENFRPDVKKRLNIDYENLSRINPRLIYGSISGFGEDGPYSQRPGLDPIIQAIGGLMSITGLPGQGPVRAGIAISDIAAGLYCAIAVLMALYDRERTGKGQWVRTSLLEAEIATLDFQAARWLMEGVLPEQEGNNHPTGVPIGMFQTSDGSIVIAPGGQALFSRFAKLAGREDWLTDPRFNSGEARYENREILRIEVAEIMKCQSTAAWIESCSSAGVPCGRVNNISEVFSDPQVSHLNMSRRITSKTAGDLELVSQPIHFGNLDFKIRMAAPDLGEHTQEILAGIALGSRNIQEGGSVAENAGGGAL